MLLFLKSSLGLLTLSWLMLTGSAQAAIELRIAVKKDVTQVRVGSSTNAIVKDAAGRKLGDITERLSLFAFTNGNKVSLNQWQAEQMIIEPSDNGYVWLGESWYRGRLRLIIQNNRITAVNLVDLEEYLYSVVGAEAVSSWPIEALKAQAVAARTYALYRTKIAGNRFYDLDATTNSQVYKGVSSEAESTLEAVKATEGQILTYQNEPIMAVFHASSGGHTENVEDVWSSPLPYLRGVEDYDQQAPSFQWTKTFSSHQLSRLFGGIGQIKKMTPERISPQGRISSMRVVGEKGSKVLPGQKVREILGLKSTLFTISQRQNSWEIAGRGYGHGLGLSQWGAYYMSLNGANYQEILSHYYTSVEITTLN